MGCTRSTVQCCTTVVGARCTMYNVPGCRLYSVESAIFSSFPEAFICSVPFTSALLRHYTPWWCCCLIMTSYIMTFFLSVTILFSPTTHSESVVFGVYTDTQCTDPLSSNAQLELPSTSSGCSVSSYIDPNGFNQTNANFMFNCCENFVEYMQYPGSDTCDGPGLLVYNLLSTDCGYFETHLGATYQELEQYSVPCSQSNDLSQYGSNITEKECKDSNYVPTGGNWIVSNAIQNKLKK